MVSVCTHPDSCGSRPAAPQPPSPRNPPEAVPGSARRKESLLTPPAPNEFLFQLQTFFSISDFHLGIFHKDTERCSPERNQQQRRTPPLEGGTRLQPPSVFSSTLGYTFPCRA